MTVTMQTISHQLVRCQTDIEQLKRKHEALATAASREDVLYKDAERSIKEVNAQISSIKQEVLTLRAESIGSFAGVVSRIESVQVDIKKHIEQVDRALSNQLYEELNASEEEGQKTLEDHVRTGIDIAVEATEKAKTQLDEKISGVDARVDILDRKVGSLATKIDELSTTTSDLVQKASNIDSKLDAIFKALNIT